MNYQEFKNRTFFNQEEILGYVYGTLVDDPPEHFDAHLPAPPFLMLDRITDIQDNGRQGRIVAEQDVRLDAWFFQCHMPGDPVQPGCLCVDAVWQLMGFYGVRRGALGTGRALGCGEVAFNGQIRPFDKIVRYELDIRRFSLLKESGASIIIGDGKVFVDDQLVTEVNQARVGIFKNIAYSDYPKRSRHSLGGIMRGE